MRFFRSDSHHCLKSILVLAACLALLSAGCSTNSGAASTHGSGNSGSPDMGTVSEPEGQKPSAADDNTDGSESDNRDAGPRGNAPGGEAGESADTSLTSGSAAGITSETTAGVTSGSAAEADTVSADAETVKDTRKLKYIDAWNEWHVMDVDPAVAENIYDPGKWKENDGLTTLEDDRYEVLQGVDVSEHQGYIDWNKVAEAGFRFAFIRVGYRGYGEAGNLYEDATAVDNLRAAKAAGLKVGTYIFSQALNEEEAREEGALAVRVITDSGVETDLPLMYDPELIKDDWGRANDITRDQVSLNTAAFKDQVENTSDLKVDIYSNLPWEHNYFDAATMNQYQIWYADYEKLPQTPYHFVWWQYTNEGYVPGIEGRVDLNLWVMEKKTEE